jgi:hypothetical protein
MSISNPFATRGGRTALLALLAVLASRAAALWLPPAAVVAHMNSDRVRELWGVERAERDAKVPHVLVVRVGGHWYEVPAAARMKEASRWLDDWRHNVAQGVVAVLDAATRRPVVQFGPGGRVIGVTEAPRP